MPSFTTNSDGVVVAPVNFGIYGDGVIVAPISFQLYGDGVIVSPLTTTIYGDAVTIPATAFVLSSDTVLYASGVSSFYGDLYGQGCVPYLEPLVEGVDYDLDRENGLIRFKSSGILGSVLGNLQAGICGVSVDACCQDSGCVYLGDPAPPSCDGGCYVRDGYDTVFQEGAEDYRSTDEKMIKRATLEAEPEPESSPPELQCDIGFARQPNCMTWRAVRPLSFECQSNKTAAQHAADRTRPDDSFHFPTWQRGQYISTRFRVTGIGGAGDFSAIHKLVKGWGQHDAP